MTGANTDKVETPLWAQANAIILALASALFDRWGYLEDDKRRCRRREIAQDQCYNAWFALRKIAEMFLANRSCRVRAAEREMLASALKFAHEMAHDTLPGEVPVILDCQCSVAEKIRDLMVIMADDVQRKKEAHHVAA